MKRYLSTVLERLATLPSVRVPLIFWPSRHLSHPDDFPSQMTQHPPTSTFAGTDSQYMLFLGLLIRLLGCLANLRARSPTGTPTELVLCQILQGIGGGFSAISIQVSAQASVAHADVATITAMVLLISEIGNSVGSAMSTGMWAYYMPLELERYVPNPQGDEGLIRELYGSMMEVVRYERGSEVRVGAELAYHAVM